MDSDTQSPAADPRHLTEPRHPLRTCLKGAIVITAGIGTVWLFLRTTDGAQQYRAALFSGKPLTASSATVDRSTPHRIDGVQGADSGSAVLVAPVQPSIKQPGDRSPVTDLVRNHALSNVAMFLTRAFEQAAHPGGVGAALQSAPQSLATPTLRRLCEESTVVANPSIAAWSAKDWGDLSSPGSPLMVSFRQADDGKLQVRIVYSSSTISDGEMTRAALESLSPWSLDGTGVLVSDHLPGIVLNMAR